MSNLELDIRSKMNDGWTKEEILLHYKRLLRNNLEASIYINQVIDSETAIIDGQYLQVEGGQCQIY